ncbi:MAG: hypothetical protein KGD64_10625 [Candidatus Heimdallarchaeota archaeon]|nr:hypothetical protein [Candidatus Heimdallarchaeota archaeon]
MALQVKQDSSKRNLDYLAAFGLGFILVMGYILLSFAALTYLLWMITTMYVFLMSASIWIGLLISIGFLLGNVIGILVIIYFVNWIIRKVKGETNL